MTVREYQRAKDRIYRAAEVLNTMGEKAAARRLWAGWSRGIRKYLGVTIDYRPRKTGDRSHLDLKLGHKR